MEIELNWIAILTATVSIMILGYVWYHEKVFGATWMKLSGLKEKDLRENQAKPMVISTLWAILVPFALYHIVYVTNAFYSDASWLSNSVGVGLWVGVVFCFLTTFMQDGFALRPGKLSLINGGYNVSAVLLAAIIIGLIGG